MIKINFSTINEITVVAVKGKLNTSTSPQFEKALQDLISDGVSKVILNMNDLDYISSIGLREILSAGKRLASADGRLIMCQANEIVYDVLSISGFTQMFEYCEMEKDAIARLS